MVFPQGRIQAAFAETVGFLRASHIPYMVVGALAVAVWGRSRATADLDFQVQLPNMESLVSAGLEKNCWKKPFM